MPETFCTLVGQFERGQLFRQHCFNCVHNTAHLGDNLLFCRYLEYRPREGKAIPDSTISIRIPSDYGSGFFPEPVLEAAKEEAPPPEPVEEKTPDDVTGDEVPDIFAVFRVCFHFWRMEPNEVCLKLGYKTTMDLFASGMSPLDAWQKIRALNE